MNPKFLLEDVAFPTPISSKPGFRTKMFCDLTLKVGDKSIKANKLFLAEASRTFYRQLTQNEGRRQIEITDLSFEVAEQMIEFIYEDKIEDMARYAKDLLVAANLVSFESIVKFKRGITVVMLRNTKMVIPVIANFEFKHYEKTVTKI
jgi:hypothetical protein